MNIERIVSNYSGRLALDGFLDGCLKRVSFVLIDDEVVSVHLHHLGTAYPERSYRLGKWSFVISTRRRGPEGPKLMVEGRYERRTALLLIGDMSEGD